MTKKEQREMKRIFADEDAVVMHKDGTVSVRRSYFYTHGKTAESHAADVQAFAAQHGFETVVVGTDVYHSWPKDSYFNARIMSVTSK